MIQPKGQIDVVYSRRTVQHAQLIEEASILQEREVGALLEKLASQRGVAVQDRATVEIDDGGVICDGHIGDERVQQIVEVGISLERALDRRSHGSRVVRIDSRAGKIRDGVDRGISDLLREQLSHFRGGVHPLAQKLGDVQVRE